ncbi:PAS domain S-box protein [uncultured Flavobacterium sp.]|uniref:sensor histidine kinase n=1 Tax=uncultured Flavobacterium sp. TaxID=165435 RepID=UPI0030EF2C66
MKNAFSNNQNIANAIALDLLKLEDYFEKMLLFIAETCSIDNAFITLVDSSRHTVKSKIGLDFLTNPTEIICFQQLVDREELLVVSNLTSDSEFQAIEFNNSFDFFAGFPIKISDNLVYGTLCILNNKSVKLTSIALKTIKHAVAQIECFLQVYLENQRLNDVIYQNENSFHLLKKNSREFFNQFDLNGNVTHISKNWTSLLGYSEEDILGSNYSKYFHPDDLDSSSEFLNTIVEKTNEIEEHVYRIRHMDGHYIWFSCKIEVFVNNKGTFFMGISRDITEYVEDKNTVIKQKTFYEKIINGLPTGVTVFDSDFKYLYINPSAIANEDLREFIIGKNDFEYVKKTNQDENFAINRRIRYQEALQKKQTIEWEETLNDKLGKKKYYNRKITPLFHEDGALDVLISFEVDITEIKNTQLEVLNSKKLTSKIIKNAGVGILVQGPNLEILENNAATCQLLGISQNQLLGKTNYDEHWNVIHLDGANFKAEDYPVPQAIKHLKPIQNIIMGVNRPVQNDLVWLLVSAIPVFDNDEALIYVICCFSDITTLKLAEEALKASNERFKFARKATSDLMWDWNIETGTIFFEGMGATQFGVDFENNTLLISESKKFVHPDDIVEVFNSLDKALDEGAKIWSGQYRYLKQDGTYAYVKDKAVIIRDGNGKAIRVIGAQQDITYEKKLKDDLIQSEKQFKGAFVNSSIGMAIIDFKGKWEEINSEIVELFGYSKVELFKLTFSDLTHPDDLGVDLDNFERLASGLISKFNGEKRFFHKNGAMVWVNFSVSVLKNSSQEPLYFISQFVDITNRKEVQQENILLVEENIKSKIIQLNEAKNMYRLLADNMVDLVCSHGLDGKFQYVSPSIFNILGYFPAELIGFYPEDFVHIDDVNRLKKSILDFKTKKENTSAEVRFLNRKGKIVWCEIKINLVQEEGVLTSFHSATRDITSRKLAELKVEEALQKEIELKELKSNLVSTISHEFRTPMTTIRASAELIQMYLENQEINNYSLLQNRINTITGEIDRLVELMDAVLIISKDDLGKTNFYPVNIDLKEVCFDIMELLDINQNQRIKLKKIFKGDSFIVFADRKLMEYTLINLLNNAIKYSLGSGDILLNLTETETFIIVEIIDFGIGIPKEDLDKLFNTFFRARNTIGIQGTGLGLYIVKRFTERNSGSIQLESKLGEGTKVTLQFLKIIN